MVDTANPFTAEEKDRIRQMFREERERTVQQFREAVVAVQEELEAEGLDDE